jgi:hypothetical protein
VIRDAIIKYASDPKVDPSMAKWINILSCRSASGPHANHRRIMLVAECV